jgi:endogenous inhibitor of DNA gyrase (YacG/DUF329 family)
MADLGRWLRGDYRVEGDALAPASDDGDGPASGIDDR